MSNQISIGIKIQGLDDLYDGFRQAGADYEAVMSKAMLNSTTRVQNDARENIRKHGTTYQGNLAKNTRRRDPVSATRGVVAVSELYGGAVEFGRRAGKQPPSKPLERWGQIKLGQPGLGFIIARKIAREGTKAQPFIEPALRDNIGYIFDQFKQGAEIILRNIARGGAVRG
jgi:hypothetical protein